MSMRAVLFLACAVAFGQPADLVLRNGKIVTMNAAQPAAEAMALGGNTDAAKWIGPRTRVMTIPDDEIVATGVVYTIVGGKVAYEGTARMRR
jgi:predicted amidohydrolase YtcJ